MTLRKALAAIFLMTIFLAPAHARAPLPPGKTWELSDEMKSAGFSGTIRVDRGARTIYQRSFGLAEKSFAVPVTRETRFRIASITKLFTSVAILRLADRGQIDLDAPFRRYLTDYPGPGAEDITVRQLLGHMSGLPQFDTAASFDEAVASGLPQYSNTGPIGSCSRSAAARRPWQRRANASTTTMQTTLCWE